MPAPKTTEDLRHTADSRANLPSAEHATVMSEDDRRAKPYHYTRNRDLDPQLVWRGKDAENERDLEVMAPPIYVQERIRPKVLIEDLRRHSDANPGDEDQTHMFADFNGLPSPEARTEFYQHQANWSNRMILGDSLQVMASLAEREGLKGQVQCIYMDPPYGINFSSNWQWSTDSRVVKDDVKSITQEPEQIKAFRDTWRDGVNSYLSYLRDRLTVARDLLADSGSIFVQMGDENVHRVRAVMDEVFGDENFVNLITFTKSTAQTSRLLSSSCDYLIWFAKNKPNSKYRNALQSKIIGRQGATGYNFVEPKGGGVARNLRPAERTNPELIDTEARVFAASSMRATRQPNPNDLKEFRHEGDAFNSEGRWCWKTNENGLRRLGKAGRLVKQGRQLSYKRYFDDFAAYPMTANWTDTSGATNQQYVVETSVKVIQRCILMTTDPGDLVLDPTCGSGTTPFVSEQWGRRWITVDTSRVALALARGRIMGARYPYYLLQDSEEGIEKRAEIARTPPHFMHIITILTMCVKASFISASLISLSRQSRTTPRSMSYGSGIKKPWSRSGSCSTRSAALRLRSGRFRAMLNPAGRMRRVRCTPSGGSIAWRASARLTHP